MLPNKYACLGGIRFVCQILDLIMVLGFSKKLTELYGMEDDPLYTEAKTRLSNGALSFVTGEAVHIINEEAVKATRRSKLLGLSQTLEFFGASDDDLDKVLREQITKASKV